MVDMNTIFCTINYDWHCLFCWFQVSWQTLYLIYWYTSFWWFCFQIGQFLHVFIFISGSHQVFPLYLSSMIFPILRVVLCASSGVLDRWSVRLWQNTVVPQFYRCLQHFILCSCFLCGLLFADSALAPCSKDEDVVNLARCSHDVNAFNFAPCSKKEVIFDLALSLRCVQDGNVHNLLLIIIDEHSYSSFSLSPRTMIVGQPSHGFSALHIHSMVDGGVFVCGHTYCMKSMVDGGVFVCGHILCMKNMVDGDVFICGHIFCMKTIGKLYFESFNLYSRTTISSQASYEFSSLHIHSMADGGALIPKRCLITDVQMSKIFNIIHLGGGVYAT